MLVYILFAASVGLSVALFVGAAPGLVAGLMLTGAGYAAKQVSRED